MKRFLVAALASLALLAGTASAQFASGGGPVTGNVVAFYDQSYFGTIDGTQINASQYVFLKPFRCYSGGDSLGTIMWGSRIRLEIQLDNFATAGSASVEFGRFYAMPYAWDVTDYSETLTSAQLGSIPMNLAATNVHALYLYSGNFTNYGTGGAAVVTLINEASAAAALTHTIQYIDILDQQANQPVPLPPVASFAFDAGTGTWTSGTVKVRAWVFAD